MRESGAVLELGRDGAFDVDAASEKAREIDLQASETLREKGNAAFQRRAFAVAVALYSQAIEKNPHNHLLYSNRSAAHYQLQQYALALDDAEQTIARAPKWPKAFARKAAACEALARWHDALDAYETIVTLDDDAEASKARTKIQQLQRRLKQSKSSGNGPVKKGFFHDPKTMKASGIYAEKEDVVKPVVDRTTGTARFENDEERRWRYMLSRLKKGCNKDGVNASGERVVLDDGVFAKLLQEHEFQALIYPGIPKEQLAHAPRNLQELLEDPWYEQELLALMPKVQAKAQSVLGNVKKRGAAQGEVMDAATERQLMPQVLQEAFGREVLAMVHRINYKKHVLLANDARTVADPTADEAGWDQLPEETLDALLSRAPLTSDTVAGVGVLDGFLGDDWLPLIVRDAQRMAKNGLLLEAAGSAGRMRFVETNECEKEYPALAELLAKLHALPFEINAKRGDRATLCAQFAHCTAVHELREYSESQRLRLDCGAGDKDNGFKVSCVYFLDDAPRELQLRTSLDEDGGARVQRVPVKRDRLVLFQSQRVFNELTAASDENTAPLLYVAFWIHGRELK